jgi:branched-chain amino acid aminotransferase
MEDLVAADEAFIASTTREVSPVASIDEHEFDGIGPLTRGAADAVRRRIRAELDGG